MAFHVLGFSARIRVYMLLSPIRVKLKARLFTTGLFMTYSAIALTWLDESG